MTRKEAMAELIEKVEAGEPAKVETWFAALGVGDYLARDAAGGSLDAAKALHEAVLPEWIWGRQKNGALWVAKRPYTFRVAPGGNNLARAWLLAILRALYAREAGT